MAKDSYSELVLRFEAPLQPNGPYRVEAVIDGMGLWTGGSFNLALAALESEGSTPALYGVKLWSALTASNGGWSELSSIFSKAWGSGDQKIRLRFMLDPDSPDLHRVRWEMLIPTGDAAPVGVNPNRPVSRFMPLPSLPEVSTGYGFEILLAIANPSDLKPPFAKIDIDTEVSNLLDSLQPSLEKGLAKLSVLAGITGVSDAVKKRLENLSCPLVPGPTTRDGITQQMNGKHALHLIAHGEFKSPTSILLLENDTGELKIENAQDVVVPWSAGKPRLIFLQSCRSDPQDALLPAAGIGPGFLENGVPAVVAMRDYVGMEAARKFSSGFYKNLLNTGEVDVAVNFGRSQTYQFRSGDWSIPVLYSRLRSGDHLWAPDPLRQSIQSLAEAFKQAPEVLRPFPLEVTVINNVDMVTQELDQPAASSRIDAVAAVKQALASNLSSARLTVMLGKRGSGKSALLKFLFVELASSSVSETTTQPIYFRLGDCQPGRDDIFSLCQGWSTMLKENLDSAGTINTDPAYLRGEIANSAVNLLIDGDDDIGETKLRATIHNVKKFIRGPNRTAVLTMDESAFDPSYFDKEQTTVMIFQDLRPDTLAKYLNDYSTLDSSGGGAQPLPSDIKDLLMGPLRDLAGVPWLLSRILDLVALGSQDLRSRFRLLDRIVRERLGLVNSVPGGRLLAGAALQQMAWSLHSRGAHHLLLSETYSLLGSVRGLRDFPLDQFRRDLLACRLLVVAAPEGLRFAYGAAHSYFTSCYLNGLSKDEQEETLRAIVAGLSRPDRLRRWQGVLLLLAGQTNQPDTLLQHLMELGFGEGEHLLLAARCVNEVRAVGKPLNDKLVIQLTDSLIWWSSPRSDLSARSRCRAVEAFGYLLESAQQPQLHVSRLEADNQTRIVLHLLHLVLDHGRTDSFGHRMLDFSNIRLQALSLLFLNRKATTDVLTGSGIKNKQHNQAIAFLETWEKGDIKAIGAYLNNEHDTLFAGLAAFALLTWDSDEATTLLRDRFHKTPADEDLHWLMIDGLLNLRSKLAIELIDKFVADPTSLDPALVKYVVYAIGKLGCATAESKQMQFLEGYLKSDDTWIQGLALRACAEIIDAPMGEQAKKLRDVCHLILKSRYREANRLLGANPNAPPAGQSRFLLINYALDALALIGNIHSLDVLREFYLHPVGPRANAGEELLRRNSWEVAERIRFRGVLPPTPTPAAESDES